MAKPKKRSSTKTKKPAARSAPKKKAAKPKARTTQGGIGAPIDERLDVAAYARRLTMDVPETLRAVHACSRRMRA